MAKLGWGSDKPRKRQAQCCFAVSTGPFPRRKHILHASAAPRDFARLHVSSSGAVLLQTKITRFVSVKPGAPVSSVDLYSVVHVADKSYYEELNKELAESYDAVYFELMTGRDNLAKDARTKLMTLVRPIAPTARAITQSKALGAMPQINELDLDNGWIADLTMEEIAELDSQGDAQGLAPSSLKSGNSAPTFAASAGRKLLRICLFLLPCPELHVLLLDAAESSFQMYLLPVYTFALLRGDVLTARRLKFSQTIQATTNRLANTQLIDPVTAARNQRVLESILTGFDTCRFTNVAVVYGAWHCDNLGRLLENQLGLEYHSARWKTAMEAEPALTASSWSRFWSSFYARSEAANTKDERVRLPILAGSALFLLVAGVEVCGGLDWSRVVTDIALFLEGYGHSAQSDRALEIFAYGIRHGAIYFFLRQWLELEKG
jgi:hypothetical protein